MLCKFWLHFVLFSLKIVLLTWQILLKMWRTCSQTLWILRLRRPCCWLCKAKGIEHSNDDWKKKYFSVSHSPMSYHQKQRCWLHSWYQFWQDIGAFIHAEAWPFFKNFTTLVKVYNSLCRDLFFTENCLLITLSKTHNRKRKNVFSLAFAGRENSANNNIKNVIWGYVKSLEDVLNCE